MAKTLAPLFVPLLGDLGLFAALADAGDFIILSIPSGLAGDLAPFG